MADRAQFPPPPYKSGMVERGGEPSLGWSNWFGLVASWLQRVRVVSADVDWPNILAGATAYADITVTGAAVGDFATPSLDPTNADLEITAAVTTANTVRVWVTNRGAGAVNLAAGTTRIRLEKAR